MQERERRQGTAVKPLVVMLVVAVIGILNVGSVVGLGAAEIPPVRTPEEALRRAVVESPLPKVDPGAVARVPMVAVFDVVVEQTGRVSSVLTLEALDQLAVSSMAATLYRWTFATDTKRRIGKLTFYIVNEQGVPKVVNARGAPYIGPTREGPGSNARPNERIIRRVLK